jgi:hypothetical protein
MVFFVYKVFGEVMTKFRQNHDLCRKVKYVQISPIQQPDQVSMALTRKSLTDLSHLVLRPNRMLIVCVPRNQVSTHTV